MINQLNAVKQFMLLAQQPVRTIPSIDDVLPDEHALRESLHSEEIIELNDGINHADLTQIFDGLCDSLYVIFGTAHTYGLAPLLLVGFAEVHRSNMSKLWTAEEVSTIAQRDGIEYVIQEVTLGKFLVKRRSDGKLIKPKSYSPPNLHRILEEAEGQFHLNFDTAEEIHEIVKKKYNLDDDQPEDEDEEDDEYTEQIKRVPKVS